MQNQTDFSDLALPKRQAGRSIFAFSKIIFFPVIIYVFALLGFTGAINFNVELHTILMMGVILAVALVFTRHSAELAYNLFVSRGEDFRASLKKFIVANLLEFGGVKKSSAKFEEFLDGYARDFRNDNLAGIGAAVFPMLGILGTFISIAISMPSFSSDTSSELEKEIGILLNGVGTAFYVSIYGIFLALWWMFFEKIGASKFERFASEQKELSKQFFWQENELQLKYMSVGAAHFKSAEAMFAAVTADGYLQNLQDAVNTKFSAYKELQELESQILGEAKENLKDNIKLLESAASRQDEFVKIHSEILKSIINFNAALNEVELKFAGEYARLNDLISKRADTLENSAIKFERGLASLDASLKEFGSRLMSEQNAAMDAFKASLFEGANAFKNAYEQEVRASADDERDELIAELKKNISEIDKEASQIIKKIENTSLIDEDR